VTVLQLLTRLRDLGVAVHSEGGRLTVRAPRGTLTTELRDELNAHRTELVTLLTADAPIPRAARDRPLPLSFGQQRLWFAHQLDPRSAAYNIPLAARLSGPLDPGALRRAIEDVTARHEVLRTTVSATDGVPAQRIRPPAPVPLPVADVTAAADPLTAAHDLARGEVVRPFDLAADLPLRALLVRLAPDDHVLVLTAHHIAVDEWSAAVLWRDLATAYAARQAGTEPGWPPLPVQYADFAAWQRARADGSADDGELRYWRQRLSGLRPLALPADRPRPAAGDPAGAAVGFEVPAAVVGRLAGLRRRHGTTLFMTLLAVFDVLLARICGQADVAVGTPVGGRGRAELESLAGFFVNTVVLRTDLSGDPSFTSVLARVRATALAAYAHQNLQFERLIDAAGTNRDASRHPLAQVMFRLDESGPPPALPGLAAERFELDCDTALADLRLVMTTAGDRLGGRIEYRTALFGEHTVRLMTDRFLAVLAAVSADPGLRISAAPVLLPGERQRLMAQGTGDPAPGYEPMASQFDRQAGRSPGAAALVWQDGALSYADLRGRVLALAGRLRACGAGPDTAVAICLPRGPDLVTAILAVWAAGAAYVPLSPDGPGGHTAFLLRDCRASILLSTSALLDDMPAGLPQVICLDQDDPAEPLAGPARPGPGTLAYVIYTSGSTGRPKGVMVTHGGLANLVHGQQRAFGVSPGHRVLQFASPAFDASVSEIAVTLGCGAALVIAGEAARTNPEALAAQCAAEAVTMATVPPAMLAVLDAGSLPGLRTVISAGDRLPAAVAARWAPGRLLINAYGPTETTVCATAGGVTATDPAGPHAGRPIRGLRCYVVDRHGALAPPGMAGELCVAGPSLARGYLGRPDLTAAVVTADPFAADGSRLYRTGDLARWQAAGTLEILGRADDQVKVRGVRVEPAEVEAALGEHPSVRSAGVWLTGPAGDPQLGAWIVLAGPGQPPDPGGLRDFLARRLPAPLIPATFTAVAELPLLPSGKLDRAALPGLGEEALPPGTRYREPQTPAERTLAAIWCEVLGTDRAGADDDFFELGGDSIKSIQVIARARAAGLRLTIADVFAHPTVSRLAAAAGKTGEPVIAEQGPVTGSAPLAPIQHWFLEGGPAQASHHNQARSLDLPPTVTPGLIAAAFGALLTHHDALRLRIGGDKRGRHQWFAPPAPATAGPAGSAALVWTIKAEDAGALQRSLDIEAGPVTRMGVVTETARTRLIWTVHHLAVDAVSWRILLDDLTTALDQLGSGGAVALPPKTTAFRDWAHRLTDHGRRGTFAAQRPYWCATARNTAGSALPADEPTPGTGGGTAVHRGALSREQTAALLRETGHAYRTRPHELLAAALARTLSRWTGAGDVVIDVENHGRHSPDADIDLSRTAGWFTALAPVLITGADAPDGRLVPAVKEALRAVPWLGYGVLRYLADDTTGRELAQVRPAAVGYNHLGDIGDGEPAGALPAGPLTSPHGARPHQLEITTAVEGGRLTVEVQYPAPGLHAATAGRFTADFLGEVAAITEHCRSRPAGAATVSDFPLAELDQATLDQIIAGAGAVVADIYPLSPLQQGMAFHTMLDPGSGVYHEQTLRRLDGPLDLAALAAAVDQLTARHPVLRSQFRLDDMPRPRQVVLAGLAAPLRVLDLRDGGQDLDGLLAADRAEGFALDRAPLWRITVARTGPAEHYLLLSQHHALLDGWSVAIVFDELFTLYRAAAAGGPPPGLPTRRPYRDYIAHVAALDTGPAAARWSATLGDLTAPTPLPAAAQRDGPGYAEHRWDLTPELTGRLARQARAGQLTLNTIVHAAWALLLAHHCGAADVTFGSTVSGRGVDLPGAAEIVGLLINTVPARVWIDPGLPTGEWLRRVQRTLAEQRADEHLPLTAIHPLTGVPAGQPLFRTVVVFENYPTIGAGTGGYGDLRVGDCGVVHHDNHPLMLLAAPGEQLTLRLGYDLRHYDAATVTVLAGQLTEAIGQLAGDPARLVGEILLATPAERAALAGPGPAGPPVPRQLVPGQIADQLARYPARTAVIAGDRRISGQDLLARADAIAAALRALGAGPESVVAVAAERDAGTPATILGIWRSGAAYLPLDPADPVTRRAQALREARAAAVISTGGAAADLAGAGVPVLDLDRPLPPGTGPTTAPPHPDGLAYVMFTSGSTGRPKPVGISHRSLANLLAAMAARPGIGPDDVVLASTALTFDISMLELLGPLVTGARLVIGDGTLGTDPERLGQLIGAHGVTVAQATPSAWRLLLDGGWRAAPGLRVLCGGEQLPGDLADRITATAAEVWNLYGPTETTIWSTADRVPPGGSPVTIGLPIANTTCHVLGPGGRPCPVGVRGELYLGGAGVARGYLGRPDLTAERFVADPFGPPGARLYRTGDLVQRRADGRLDFAGRADDQIKLRGHRIEPGEIEALLTGHPDVSAAAVAPDPGDPGRLVAYTVPAGAPDGGSGTRAALRATQVSDWGSVWDTALDTDPDDPTFDISGWVSGITGQPIPAEEMRVCVDATVERIRALEPRRILEIGCGTGLLLWRLAPQADSYTGTDLAERTLDTLGKRLDPGLASRVTLLRRDASDVSGLPERWFDVVVLNSVVQYFPDPGYLRTVCERAVALVRPGGHVFVGDVRSLPLLRAYHAAIALANAPRHTPAARLRAAIERGVREETELVIDPGWFTEVAAGLPGVSHVAILPKQRRQNPELSHLRYDVVIEVLGQPARAPADWLDWADSGMTPGTLRDLLRDEQPAQLALTGLPNSRVLPFTLAEHLIDEASAGTAAGQVADQARAAAAGALDPEDLLTATAGLPYRIELSWASRRADGAFDAVISHTGQPATATVFPAARGGNGALINDPLAVRLLRHRFTALEPKLRAHLADRLPPHLVPAVFVPAERLPLNRNGKLDRAALPAPSDQRPAGGARYEPPGTATEQGLAEAWRTVLGVARIGRNDDFFALGGHSLLATQVAGQVRASLGVTLPLRTIFEAPVLASLAAAIDRARADRAHAPIRPADRSRPIPLSAEQQRLWFLHRMEPGSTEYNVPAAVRLSGHLDTRALGEALTAVAARHEALRTAFTEVDGVPIQVVRPAGPVPLPVTRAAGLAAVRRLLRDDATTPFDLAAGPPLRAHLYRLTEDDHVLSLVLHHIAADQWSVTVLTQDLATAYEALAAGRPVPLPPLPLQYADVAAWQRQALDGGQHAGQRAYWRRRLAGLAPIDLPAGRPRPAHRDPAAATVHFTIPAELAGRLRDIGRARNATMYMTLLAGFSALLSRYCRQDDIAVGTPVAGRTRPEMEGLIGFFVRTLVLRTDLSGDPTFLDLLDRVRQTALGAYANQDVPFEQLVSDLSVPRDLSRNPLFDVMFSYEDVAFDDQLTLPGLRAEPIAQDCTTTVVDLTLNLTNTGQHLDGAIEFRTDLFDRPAIERMARHLSTLLAAIAADPGRRTGSLPLLTTAERDQVLGWSRGPGYAGTTAPPAGAGHAALVTADGTLSRGELDRRANALAHWLRGRGVRAEHVVGLRLPRGPGLVTAMLAVWRAGGACLPLDPDLPPARVRHMTGTARPSLTLRELPDTTGLPGQPPDVQDLPGSAAVILFTSGSTGLAKPVTITRANLRHIQAAWATGYGADRHTWLSTAPPGFDVFTGDILRSIELGGTLVLAGSPRLAIDPPELERALAGHAVTACELSPHALGLLCDHLDEAGRALPGVRLLAVATSPYPAALHPRVRRYFPRARVVTAYGLTETTVDATCGETDSQPPGPCYPIGAPLAATDCYLLDRRGQLVPAGVTGELYLGGPGVARGYPTQPGLTAERFLPDPFAADGRRLYRTGDLARWTGDGRIEFAGRADDQLSYAGHRIEPAEIETILAGHPAVRAAAAGLRPGPSGELRLVAWLSPQPPPGIRDWAAERLPAALVPAVFTGVAALPLTAAGKLDRRALPSPAPPPAGRTGTPATATERALARIWAGLLGVPGPGPLAGFFDLGGHSLLVTRLVSRIRGELGREVPLRLVFEHPVLRDLAVAIDTTAAAGRPGIARADRARPLPLSFGQQRLWFLQHLEPGSAAYNVLTTLRLRGPLDHAALARALSAVIARHEVLRTTFGTQAGQPVQVIEDPVPAALPVTVCSGAPEARQLITADASEPFDLAAGPPLRAHLYRLTEDDHVLSLVMHHLVTDEWSEGLLRRDLAAYYRQETGAAAADLAPLPVQYADYAVWQRAELPGVLASQLGYWTDRLTGLSPLDLPADRPRPRLADPAGAVRSFRIEAPLAGSLRELSTRHQATPFMTLLAAFGTLLARYTGQGDIAVGTPVSGRSLAELEDLAGFFVNTLVLRTDMSGDPTFTEALARVRQTCLDAYAHQDLPFETLVDELNPPRDLSRAPLVDIMISYEHGRGAAAAFAPELACDGMPVPGPGARYDLTLSLSDTGGRIDALITYRTALFRAATIDRMAGQFRALLAGIAAAPSDRLSRLPLATAGERRWLAARSQGPVTATPELVPQQIAAQAALRPDAPAVVAAGRALSYRALMRRAEALARQLAAAGVGQDSVVGICLNRGADLVSAVLAIWLAGGAYLPLDPDDPAERLAFLIEDAGAALVITARGAQGRLPAGVSRLFADGRTGQPPAACLPPPAGGHLAYVLYTSGSTGRPKGVAVTQAGLANVLSAVAGTLRIGTDDRLLAITTLGFDIALGELVLPLMRGGIVHVADRAAAGDPARVRRLAHETGATLLQATPTLWRAILDTPGPPLPGRALCTGEAAPADLATRLAGQTREAWNLYGPTETTIWSTMARLRRTAAVPIGTPIANTSCYLVGTDGLPVPAGVPGELLIGGAGLARGYAGKPDLTAERFVPDPFTPNGGRLYRTGDLARWRADGQLEFLGRIDEQVKVRGFRIEPGEVEAVLAAHPAVAACAAAARPDPTGGGAHLAAWVVPAVPGQPPAAAELQRFASQRLPGYLVPSRIEMVTSLPLTPSGKVDRRRLPVRAAAAGTAPSGAPPRSYTEQVLAGLWRHLLGTERVGTEDDFFAAGGHSLLAAQLANRISAVFGTELPLRMVFEHPTLAGLAVAIEAAGPTPQRPVMAAGRDGPAPLSLAQERLWFLSVLRPDSPHNVALSWRLTGRLDVPALRRALGEAVARHEILRTVYPAPGGTPQQRVLDPVPVPLPVTKATLRQARGLLAGDAATPFDLTHGPVLRARLIRTGPGEHVLSVVLPHLAIDEWSAGLLSGEITRLYRAFTGGRQAPRPPLPPLRLQYRDYARWQRDGLGGARQRAQLAHWRERLAGIGPLRLPVDRPHPAVRDPATGWAEFAVPDGVTAGLAGLARRHRVTMFMVVLAAFTVLLSRACGQLDVAVGTPVTGRRRPELEPLIGLFINTVVVRTDLTGDPDTSEVLSRVRDAVIDALTHQDVPLEQIIDELGLARDQTRHPLFQVMVNYVSDDDPQAAQATPPDLPGVTASTFGDPPTTSQFDLRLVVRNGTDGLRGALQYRTDIFDPATAERLTGQFTAILAGMTAHPGRPAARLPLTAVPPALPTAAVVAPPAAGGPALLPALIGAQASARPGAAAVRDAERSLTYAELSEAAGRVAGHLAAWGIGPESVVALALPSTADLIVAVLGVWRAGAAYVALAGTDPLGRQAATIAASGAALVLATEQTTDRLPALAVPVTTMTAAAAAEPPAAPAPATGDHLAYLVRTSGSTGPAKMVAVTHGNLAHYTRGISGRLRPVPGAAWALPQPLTVDLGLTNLALALTTGGLLHVIDPARFVAELIAAPPDYLKITPTHLDLLLAHPDGARGLPRTALVLGGERAPGRLLAQLAARGWRGTLHGHYGPAETTVGATAGAAADGQVVLGTELPGTVCRLLDEAGQPVPAGIAAEIWIGGPGVCRGYAGRPGLTAERFVADPYGLPGSRLYRTGDIGRRRTDGLLEFLGRADDQINIGGNRIEPAEVESVLAGHPDVTAAVVAARPGSAGQSRLVAWLVPAVPADVRAWARQRLPAYMIPAVFTALPAVPVGKAGKLDRGALPAPADGPTAADFQAPQTEIEAALAALWAEVLGVARVGRSADFFELGGHSLLATKVIARVPGLFGADLPLTALFDNPTIAGLAQAIEAAPPAPGRPAARADRSAPIPASPAQRRLWLLNQLEPGSPEYNVPAAFWVRGTISPELLRRALTEIIARHEPLRTTFDGSTGEPVQVIGPAAEADLPVIPAGGLAEARRLTAELAARPFDLATGPLLRAALLRLDDDDHILVLCTHHIATDQISGQILRRELTARYRALAAGDPAPLPPLGVQYADVTAARGGPAAHRADAHLAYWRGQLAGLSPLGLPADRPRPATRGSAGAEARFTVPAPVAERLRALGRQQHATTFMTLLAGFAALLGRYCGQDDIAIGSPAGGRTVPGTEDLIGLFVNTLVLRVDLSGGPSFAELLRRVRKVALDAFAHQDLPFEALVEDLAPVRDLSRNPLFDVMFSYRVAGEGGELALAGAEVCGVPAGCTPALFDLTLDVVDTGARLDCTLEYRTDLFEHATVTRLGRHLTALLAALAGRPHQPVTELAFLPGTERRRLLRRSRRPAPPRTRPPAADPARIAVTGPDGTVSHGELARRVTELARQLSDRGIAAERVVALRLPRGAGLITAILAIWRAGGGYLPLDPGDPPARHRQLLCEIAPDLLLDTLAGPPGRTGAPDPRPAAAPPQALAVILATSGSTGTPKAVAISHANLDQTRRAWAELYGHRPHTWLSTAPAGYDVFTGDILRSVMMGGTLVLAGTPHLAIDPPALAETAERHEITALELSPHSLRLLSDHLHGEGRTLPGIELLAVATSPYPAALHQHVRTVLPSARIITAFGLTEATVDSISGETTRPPAGPLFGIGTPLPGCDCLILDPAGGLVPDGVTGELYVGGAGLARGYHRRPDLTAERFLAHPFAPGERVYRTGDLVRRTARGAIEFLGRVDDQLNVAGHRIEPGEIEARLAEHPQVREAAVTARPGPGGQDRLAAWVVPDVPAGLRAWLARQLPPHLIPAVYTPATQLPRGATGKVDRRALGDPGVRPSASYEPPATATERVLAGIWRDLLGVPRAGRSDDFFALGGHSLLAAQLVTRIQAAFGVRIPLRSIFEQPVAADLAEVIAGAVLADVTAMAEEEARQLLPDDWAPSR
jgi:amino acid adenylation domain-containing protein/non-ribosomal peptide synthase protein (TIGR01720 family)